MGNTVKHFCDICGAELHDYGVMNNSTNPQYTKWISISNPGWNNCYWDGILMDAKHSLEQMEICSECAGKIIDFIRSMKN